MDLPPNDEEEPEPSFVLEQNQRLSESVIWSHQRRFYEQEGITAWNEGAIPHHITSNPFIARAYARLVLGWLRDLRALTGRSRRGTSAALDLSRPVYILELGAGSGRFAYHFLTHFLRLHARSALRDIPIRYVMTDLAERNLDYWRAHPQLRPLVEAHILDFARFDAAHPDEIVLCNSADVLRPDSLRNPPVVIANYIFDSIPQDIFAITNGELQEARVTVASDRPEPEVPDPDFISGLSLAFENRPVSTDYYDDPDFNRILQSYKERLSEVTFLFPSAPLRCVRYLSQLSAGRMLLLSADKGYSREFDLLAQGGPGFAPHAGGFSLMVNYHAMGQYALNRGGQFLCTSRPHTDLDVVACIFGFSPEATLETRQAFDEEIAEFGPEEFYVLQRLVENNKKIMGLEEMLAWLRCANWDASTLRRFFHVLTKYLDSAPDAVKPVVRDAIQRVWEGYYFIGEQDDFVTLLGMLLGQMDYHAEAITFFQRSLEFYGPQARTYYLMAVCHYQLKQFEAALDCVHQALALDPALEGARLLRIRTEVELGEPPQALSAISAEDAQPDVEPVLALKAL